MSLVGRFTGMTEVLDSKVGKASPVVEVGRANLEFPETLEGTEVEVMLEMLVRWERSVSLGSWDEMPIPGIKVRLGSGESGERRG